MLEWQADLPFNLTWGYLPVSFPHYFSIWPCLP